MDLIAAPYFLLYRRLALAMARVRRPGAAPPHTGLSETQLAALRQVTLLPGAGRPSLRLGFADGCTLPASLALAGGALAVQAQRVGPLRPHADMLMRNTSNGHGVGRLTCMVRGHYNSQLYALGAGHVVGGSPHAGMGDHIVLRAAMSTRTVSGKLERWAPSSFASDPETAIDAALTRVDSELLRELINEGLQLPSGVGDVTVGQSMSLHTRGARIAATALGYTSLWMDLKDFGGSRDYYLHDGLAYQAADTPIGGDSGAPLWSADGRLLAMHISAGGGGAEGNGVAVPIRRVLDFMECSVVERGATVARPVAPVPSAAPVGVLATPLAALAPAGGDRVTLARTMWGEARGEGQTGMEAIASVVLNRVKRQSYWGRTVEEVCRKPYQFSCWNAGDPNRSQMLRLDAADAGYALACRIADAALRHQLPDNTNGATHYHTRALLPPPRWARAHLPCAEIGRHLFYNDIN
ncbi:cell wall hydrolase [Oxalobacteraceae bacterium OTU3REALA1]|nr:cell wall hydrolase [Oxalobacteraceae bacterium OTU3REALA1]